jgi:hypothetical protein
MTQDIELSGIAASDEGPDEALDGVAATGEELNEVGATGEAAAQAAEPAAEPASETQPRKRIRGAALFTAAVVLGVLGGVGTGYVIQYTRPATPLAPLAGSQPAYAPTGAYQGVAPAMLPASQDDATKTDGDLSKLLLSVPSGATTDDSLWVDEDVDLEQTAELCDPGDQQTCLGNFYTDGIGAIADTNWEQDGFHVEVRLSRVAAGDSGNARDWAHGNGESNPLTLPSGISGYGYEFLDSYGDNDDYASAAHGDLIADFWVSSPTKTPDPSMINGLITQQMGRL